jgi:hypothetical protein
VRLALPPAGERGAKEAELGAAARDLDKAEKAIARLVDAVAAGADPALLVSKQAELKAKADGLSKRREALQRELELLPDPEAVQKEAEVLRLKLAAVHVNKDWRREGYENVRRFLHFLFGDNPGREGLGVYLRRQPDGGWAATVKARLRLRSPYFFLVGEEGFGRPVGSPHDGESLVRPVTTGLDLSDPGAEPGSQELVGQVTGVAGRRRRAAEAVDQSSPTSRPRRCWA